MDSKYINLAQFAEDFGEDLAEAIRDKYPPGSVIYLEKKTVPSLQEKKQIAHDIFFRGADKEWIAAKWNVSVNTVNRWLREVR